MSDPYAASGLSLNSPALHAGAITPSDAADLAVTTRAIYVGGAGAVKLILAGDTEAITLVAVTAGQVLPVRAKRVLATGTTATGLVGLW